MDNGISDCISQKSFATNMNNLQWDRNIISEGFYYRLIASLNKFVFQTGTNDEVSNKQQHNIMLTTIQVHKNVMLYTITQTEPLYERFIVMQ